MTSRPETAGPSAPRSLHRKTRLPKPWTILAAALIAVAITYIGSFVWSGDDTVATASSAGSENIPELALVPDAANPAVPADTGISVDEIDRLIVATKVRVAETSDAASLQFLGRLYLQRARFAGDVTAYVLADEALTAAAATWTNSVEGFIYLGQARSALHDFSSAADQARTALDLDPESLGALALLGDAQLALGDYAGAEMSFNSLNQMLPGNRAVLVRQSRLAYLTGDGPGAVGLAQAAVADAASSSDLAFYHSFAADLAFDLGEYASAEASFQSSLDLSSPDSVAATVARAGLAEAVAAQGRIGEAIALYEEVNAFGADPAFQAALGDLYLVSGDIPSADRLYAETEAAMAAEADLGIGVPHLREVALFHSDRNRDIAAALVAAEADLLVRPNDIFANDTLAWALYRNGRIDEARAASDRATALGTPDAAMWYHSALIWEALGDAQSAIADLERTVAISPNFDPLLGPDAQLRLSRLQG